MPELPEVERVRLSLLRLIGRRVASVKVRRADVVTRGDDGTRNGPRPAGRGLPKGRGLDAALLGGQHIAALLRHGKQLAIVSGEPGPPLDAQAAIVVHLGMTGSLVAGSPDGTAADRHDHVIWTLDDGQRLTFNDPRRFGGVWTFARFEQVRQRWAQLGEDALTACPCRLNSKLQRTRRHLKAALLDQTVVAGLGNIYVDELLFRCGLHPKRCACHVDLNTVTQLAGEMKQLLGEAIAAGGSTLRDYVDGDGRGGAFQERHQVYGRAGLPCRRCGQPLVVSVVGGRTTVFCRKCQRYRR